MDRFEAPVELVAQQSLEEQVAPQPRVQQDVVGQESPRLEQAPVEGPQ